MADDDAIGSAPDWAVIAVLASVDLAVRGWEILLAVFSLAGGYAAPPWLSALTTWALFGALFYRACPVAYTPLTTVPATEPWFKTAFAASAVVVGLVLQLQPAGPMLVASQIVLVTLSGAFVLLLLVHKRAWNVLDPDGRGVAVLNDITPRQDIEDEVRRDLSRSGALGAAGTAAYVVAVVVVLAMPPFLAAVVAQVLQYSFPLPDLAILAWPAVTAIAPRARVSESDGDADWFDVEGVLVDVMETGIHSVQGLFLTTFVLLGVFEAAAFLYVGTLAAGSMAPLLETVLVTGPATRDGAVVAWNALGTVVVLSFIGVFAFRAWTVEFRRLQVFLGDWADADYGSLATARLAGSLWVPVAGAWLVRWCLQSLSTPGSPRQWLFATAWPLVLCVGSVFVCRRHGQQPTERENYWILAAFVAQTLALWLVIWEPAQSIVARLGSFVSVPAWIGVVSIVLTVLPVAMRHDDARDGPGYETVILLLVLACFALGTGSLLALPHGGVARLLGAWAFASALALSAVRYLQL